MQYPNLPTEICQPVVFPSSFSRRVFILVTAHMLGPRYFKSRPNEQFLNVWLPSPFGPGFSNLFTFVESYMTKINSLTEFRS
jgi:hypothetical protein